MAATLFLSYSHKDEALKEQLEAHLAALRHERLIEMWHDRRIQAGERFDNVISSELEAADIILLLVSSDFLNSSYCYEVELRRAMARHDRGEAIVIPVILRPCEWRHTPLSPILATPRDGKPVTTWTNQDEAFHDITRAIRGALQKLAERSRMSTTSGDESKPPSNRGTKASRVRLPRTFSEKDRDDFLEQSFEHVATLFKNSLLELETENANIETRFRRLDALRFTAVAYRDGRATARCTIWMGTRPTSVGGLGYVQTDSGETNSMNEILTVEVDNESVYLKPMGMPLFGQHPSQKMASEEAAEYLWDLFLRPLHERH